MGNINWAIKVGDPAHSWFKAIFVSEGKEMVLEKFNTACYYDLWELFEDKTLEKIIVYHPYLRNVEENYKIVQYFMDIPAFNPVFITKDAVEGLENGFEIDIKQPIGLLKAVLISFRAIWEKGNDGARGHDQLQSVYVNEWLKFVEGGIPEREAVVYPLRFTISGGVIRPNEYQTHWMGVCDNVNVGNLFSENPKFDGGAYSGFNTFPKVIRRQHNGGLKIKREVVKTFFGRSVLFHTIDRDQLAELHVKIMEGIA